jgi:hypothetical protein
MLGHERFNGAVKLEFQDARSQKNADQDQSDDGNQRAREEQIEIIMVYDFHGGAEKGFNVKMCPLSIHP